MERHLTRRELIQAAQQQEVSKDGHVAECVECRELVELLRVFQVAGKLHLPDAPAGWTEKAAAIAQGQSLGEKVRAIVARLAFDSWAMPQAVGVRGSSIESDRRLRFEASELLFDLRAEEQAKGWAFVAQVRKAGAPVVVVADTKKLLPDPAGLYQWSSSRPPRKITLRSDDLVVELPELSWKKPHSR